VTITVERERSDLADHRVCRRARRPRDLRGRRHGRVGCRPDQGAPRPRPWLAPVIPAWIFTLIFPCAPSTRADLILNTVIYALQEEVGGSPVSADVLPLLAQLLDYRQARRVATPRLAPRAARARIVFRDGPSGAFEFGMGQGYALRPRQSQTCLPPPGTSGGSSHRSKSHPDMSLEAGS
jgi:hypothetical protein